MNPADPTPNPESGFDAVPQETERSSPLPVTKATWTPPPETENAVIAGIIRKEAATPPAMGEALPCPECRGAGDMDIEHKTSGWINIVCPYCLGTKLRRAPEPAQAGPVAFVQSILADGETIRSLKAIVDSKGGSRRTYSWPDEPTQERSPDAGSLTPGFDDLAKKWAKEMLAAINDQWSHGQMIQFRKECLQKVFTDYLAMERELALATDAAGKGDEARCRAGAWEEQVAELKAEVAELKQRELLASGYHQQTGREIEIQEALDQTEEGMRDTADNAIAELLALVDAGRNRVHLAEGTLAASEAARVAAETERDAKIAAHSDLGVAHGKALSLLAEYKTECGCPLCKASRENEARLRRALEEIATEWEKQSSGPTSLNPHIRGLMESRADSAKILRKALGDAGDGREETK